MITPNECNYQIKSPILTKSLLGTLEDAIVLPNFARMIIVKVKGSLLRLLDVNDSTPQLCGGRRARGAMGGDIGMGGHLL